MEENIVYTNDELKSLIEENTPESNQRIIEFLIDKNLYTLLSPNGENLLHWASAFNNVTICEYLLNKNIHINTNNFRGATPLYYAAMKNSIDAVKILSKYNANPRIRSGFSNLFPIEITTNQEIKILLQTLDDKIIPFAGYPDETNRNSEIYKKNKFSMFVAYKHRFYMFWLMNLNHFINPYNHNNLGATISEEAETIFLNKGIESLAKQCQIYYENFLKLLEKEFFPTFELEKKYNLKDQKVNIERCLYCDMIKNLKRCGKCKSVCFCGKECQKKAHMLHKYDCK